MPGSVSGGSGQSLQVAVILFDVGDHARVNHVLGVQDHVKLLFGQQIALQNEVVYALS